MPLIGEEAPTGRAVEIINELGELKVFSILISGGEPTTHPGILPIMSAASKAIPVSSLNTNGIRHSHVSFAEKFFETASSTMVTVSLDSPDASINDINRGHGGTQAIAAIHNCITIGQPVCISAVLTEKTLATAHRLIDVFAPKVRKFKFFARVPRHAQDLKQNNHDYQRAVKSFFKRMEKIAEDRPELDIILPYKSVENSTSPVGAFNGCVCPSAKLYINAALNAYPCYYSASKQNLIATLSNSSVSEIWSSETHERIRALAKHHPSCGTAMFETNVPNRYND